MEFHTKIDCIIGYKHKFNKRRVDEERERKKCLSNLHLWTQEYKIYTCTIIAITTLQREVSKQFYTCCCFVNCRENYARAAPSPARTFGYAYTNNAYLSAAPINIMTTQHCTSR